MSLVKTYSLQCDGLDLGRRRGEDFDTRAERMSQCRLVVGGREPEATKARRAAKKLGWVRHRESFAINIHHTSMGTSEIAFDLCPNCAEDMVNPDA